MVPKRKVRAQDRITVNYIYGVEEKDFRRLLYFNWSLSVTNFSKSSKNPSGSP